MIFVAGTLAGLLVASIVINIFQRAERNRAVDAALQHEERLLDRARAAETRADVRIDQMLARISTAPRLEVGPDKTSAPADPSEKLFISDLPVDDEAWNEYTGEPDEDLD